MSSKPMANPEANLNTVSDDYQGRHLVKSIRWWDGFVLALAVPSFLFASLGASVAQLGAIAAAGVWLVSVLIGALQNNIYAEMATMMPHKSGGIGIYANEGLKRYTTFLGPLVVFGYWFGWSTVLSINGLVVGNILHDELWPKSDATIVPKIIGTLMLVGLWLFNVFGLRPGVWLSYVLGALTMIPLLIVMIVPFLNGSFHTANLQPLGLPGNLSVFSWGGISLIVTWLYLACWTTYGFECVATFAPEFSDTIKDTPRALRSSAIFSVLVYGIVPIGLVGVLGQKGVQANIYTAFDPALRAILGNGLGTIIVIMVIASLVLSANVATMDGSRSLWQMSKDRMTVTWLSHLNARGVPDVGMSLDLIVQVALMWIFGNPLAILAASNLGYVLCHVCALIAFILLRRDQPNAPRPVRLSNSWVWIAGVLAVVNTVFILVGSWQYLPGWDGVMLLIYGILMLAIAFVLYLYRIYVQDRSPRGQAART